MSRAEYQGLLEIASEQVPFGVYAIEKKGYAELRNDHCRSKTQLKNLIRGFKSQGVKVLSNDGHQMMESVRPDAVEEVFLSEP